MTVTEPTGARNSSLPPEAPTTVVGPETPRHRVRRPSEWEWRRRIRANPSAHHAYRVVIGTLGFIVVVVGLILVPLPGPGWLIVFIGVSIWASEFSWARRLHHRGMDHLRRWNAWIQAQTLFVRGSVALATCLFVNAVLWSSLKVMGIPGFVPADITAFLQTYLAL
ncbi:MAG: TIGR02611 family protein [Mobilicoccus sp.]|nr:TIGR02611 family protein [Mobilicoccus sp.]